MRDEREEFGENHGPREANRVEIQGEERRQESRASKRCSRGLQNAAELEEASRPSEEDWNEMSLV
jgi:uncharacterized membrane protein YccC